MSMNHDDVLKLKAAVLYVVNKCGEIGYMHLFKILYFANREHYAKYGRSIINDTFCALPKGPVPSFLYDAVKPNVSKSGDQKIIFDSLYNQDPTYYYLLSTKEAPDMDELSKSDILCLDKSIKENIDLDMDSLSEKSHDTAWKEAWDKGPARPMMNLSIAKAGGANRAMLEYIKENELIDSIIG
jgi:uncharacterized phage-associated protein